jgi:hypothetical protein
VGEFEAIVIWRRRGGRGRESGGVESNGGVESSGGVENSGGPDLYVKLADEGEVKAR